MRVARIGGLLLARHRRNLSFYSSTLVMTKSFACGQTAGPPDEACASGGTYASLPAIFSRTAVRKKTSQV